MTTLAFIARPLTILLAYVTVCLAVAACNGTYNTSPLPPANNVATAP